MQSHEKESSVVSDRWWRSSAQTKARHSPCVRLMHALSTVGGVVCPVTANCSPWQVPHVAAGWERGISRADLTSRAEARHVFWRWILLGPCWCVLSPVWLLSPQSCNHSGLHAMAFSSNWPVTLSALAGKGLGFVGLPWRPGHLMRMSTLWLMTFLNPSDILQMDNLLQCSHTHTTTHKHKRTHVTLVKPHWTEDCFYFCLLSPQINTWQVSQTYYAKSIIHFHLYIYKH